MCGIAMFAHGPEGLTYILGEWNMLCKMSHTGVLISCYPDQEGSKLGSMSVTRAVSTTSRHELSSSFCFFLARQGAEGNSRHSDRNISLFPS